MSADLPACYGCLVNPHWTPHSPFPPIPFGEAPKISESFGSPTLTTPEEKDVLYHLVEAWKKFCELPNKAEHDVREFNYAIHLAQQKIALRLARRADPSVWRQPNDNECAAE